jgi:4-hydroxy-3-methylbut-2-enyl diphosphate reductase
LSVDDAKNILEALKRKFPSIEGPKKEDICYVTQNRQEAVRILAPEVDAVLVVGSQNSSNSQRLAELGRFSGKPSYLIDGPEQIQAEWLEGKSTLLVTAGASAPEEIVQACLDVLKNRYGAQVQPRHIREEKVVFGLPKELRSVASSP